MAKSWYRVKREEIEKLQIDPIYWDSGRNTEPLCARYVKKAFAVFHQVHEYKGVVGGNNWVVVPALVINGDDGRGEWIHWINESWVDRTAMSSRNRSRSVGVCGDGKGTRMISKLTERNYNFYLNYDGGVVVAAKAHCKAFVGAMNTGKEE